ncbi:LuxR C-terminal-related transcriptional regulator [soil metagenome]
MAERIADIDRARAAIGREAWAEAYEEFRTFDPSRLTPQDLDSLANAAWWLSRTDESIAARQKAYAGYAAAGEDRPAAFAAGLLSMEHFLRGEPAVGGGWLRRAQRHLRDQQECVEHGFLAMLEANIAGVSGELDAAMGLAQRATEIGQRFGHRDLSAMAIHTEGLVLIAAARVAEGMALLDEAMTSVVAGELGPYWTGAIYCGVLHACLELGDLRRASEWSEAASAWCESLPPESPYPGLCRIYRAEVANIRGAWQDAEIEASRASEELMRFNPMAAAEAFYQTGEIRRRIGNFAGAGEAFARAHELGFDPQPGMALLRLAQGKPTAALSTLRLAVAGHPGGKLRRARLLAALIDVALTANDIDTARRASEELDTIAASFGTPATDAGAATARGALRLADGDVGGALESLRQASATWQGLRLPYEAARARMMYGIALRRAGDEDDALLELSAARAAFDRLGAAPDARKAAELLAERAELPKSLTQREGQVLRLVAAGKTNREIAADLVISEHTVARHLQNIFAKLDVGSRSAATAFAFEHSLT